VSLGDELPSLLLDAGTGLQTLLPLFGDRPFVGTILLTHLHWDHVQGLPFFPPTDREDARVVVGQPAQGDPVDVLSRSMSPPHFPIGPLGLRGDWSHVAVENGEHAFHGFEVLAVDVEHKGGRTFGYRVSAHGASFAYVPDALDANDDAILELAAGVDLLLRGAPFIANESERANDFGHGTVEHAKEIAKRAAVGSLMITHHAPFRSDDELEQIANAAGVDYAVEGRIVDL
jgi:phosphoribosyl 1,2-cyclic phosphodiesterase